VGGYKEGVIVVAEDGGIPESRKKGYNRNQGGEDYGDSGEFFFDSKSIVLL
jgi:hypothetical protein